MLDTAVDSEAVLQETTTTAGSSSTTTYTHGLGLISRKTSQGTSYLLSDALGSVRLETDASGNVTETRDYDAYGKQLGSHDLTGNRFRYTGQWADAAGLTFLRARYYEPATGTFLSVDPIGSAASTPYAYCGGNPLVAIDPSGCNWVGDAWNWVKANAEDIAITAALATFDAAMLALTVPTFGTSDLLAASVTGGVLAGRTAGSASAGGVRSALGRLATDEGGYLAVREGAEAGAGGRVVIGKMADITADGALGPGERTLLPQLPDLGSEAANWAQNARVLLREMRTGNPIRDASVHPITGARMNNTGFLARERGLLLEHGWTYDAATHLWSPGR